MKKILFSLVALMAVMTVQAQSICGSWRSIQPVVTTEQDGTVIVDNLTYTFNEDGTFSCVDEFTLSSEPAPTMALEVASNIEIKGAYVLEGDKLSLTPNVDTYKNEVLSISMNGQVTNNPMVKGQIKSMLNSAEFKAQFAEPEENTVKVSDSTLEMNNGEQNLTLARMATIKD